MRGRPPEPENGGDEGKRASADGFVPLFNGKDLTGWKAHPIGNAHWEVKDGILTGSGDVGHLFYMANSYENFHLRAEARINDGGNSGVFFRTPFGPASPQGYPLGGYEAQINSTHRDTRKTGSLFMNGSAPAVNRPDTPVKPGEWFTLEVKADGPHIVLTVNGETTADYVDAAPHARVGQVALQVLDAATVAQFRKVEIKELPPGDLRLQWSHGRGRFAQVKGKLWIEYVDDRPVFRREVSRNDELVALQAPDLGTDWTIHLRRDACYVQHGNGPWNKSYVGGWTVRERVPPVEKSAAARVGEWVPLFNGQDLTGWEAALSDTAGWGFEGGALVGRVKGSAPALLVSRRADYDHFHLRMETMLGEGGRSYVALRAGPAGGGPGGYQCYAVPVGGARDGATLTGALALAAHRTQGVGLCAAPPLAHKPGEWFPLEVIAEGNRLRVLIDGKTTVDYTDTNDTFTAGRLGFYVHGDSVARYRNVQIRELPPPAEPRPAASPTDDRGFVPLFNGRDLAGWKAFPTSPNNWEVKNGILTCRTGPASHLFTERDDYQDFHLRVEARVNGAGNSGLMFWGDTGQTPPLSYEADILGAPAPQHATGTLWEWTPALRLHAHVGQRLMAADQWFTQDVIAEGNRVRILINGKPAVDTTLWVKSRARGRLALQHFDPKTVIEFRKVEVKEWPSR
jgi:hypothetical protein